MSFASALIAAVVSQANPPAPMPDFPWAGQVQVLLCTMISANQDTTDYVLTITDHQAFVVGQEPRQALQMDNFAPLENLPPIARGEALVRRVTFPVGSQSAFVRQLYQSGDLVSTFISVGSPATDEQDLPFEALAGFCLMGEQTYAEASQ